MLSNKNNRIHYNHLFGVTTIILFFFKEQWYRLMVLYIYHLGQELMQSNTFK